MRKVLLTVLGAALLGFIPLAQAQAHWECMGFAVACEGSGGSARQARDDRYEAPARRYAGRYERDYGDRDYAPKPRHRAESRHETAKQQTASLEPAKAQDKARDKVAETKPADIKTPEAKVETKANETTVAKADIKADAKPEAKRPDLPVERKVATTEVKTLHGTGKTQSGMASYYGTESGSQTSSGEHFNPNALTAAHRTLPFGTKVLVTNKRNGRTVIVRINDRGPFVHGRIIDLSTAAAGVIGMRGAGVASVTVEVLGRS